MWSDMETAPKDGRAILLIATAVIGGDAPAAVVGHWTEDRWRTLPIASGLRWDAIDLLPRYWMQIPEFLSDV